MKKYLYILAIAAVSTLAACKKGGLDRFPQDAISPNLFFNNEQDLALYVNGLLSQPDRGTYLNDQSSDNVATTAAVEVKNIMVGSANSQNITGGWDWGRLRDINYFLENYKKAQVTQNIKNHYAGLARYYRAAFYLDKVKRFSDVPWYSGTLEPSSKDLYKGRDPRKLVADSIMADLDFAYKNVRESVPVGTPGKWAVATLYARAALYEGTYRKYHDEVGLKESANTFLETAAKIAGEIMGSGKFGIYNTGKPDQDYGTLFSSQDLTGNNEVILTNIFDLTKGKGQNVNSTVFGDYEQAPAKDLIQTYLMKDGSRFTDLANYAQMGFVEEFKNRDPRLVQTMVYPGWVRVPDATPYIQRLNKNFTGYHQLKGYVNSTDNNTLNGVDFPVYRYAEVLLTYAEALAELGTLTQGQLDQSVNLLRRRAGLPDLNMAAANANPDPVLKLQYPNVTANTGVILEIRRERRVEFAFENMRYDDLMRWKVGKLLAKSPEGMYFKGLGKYDLTGDGVDDIILIDRTNTIPAEDQKEKNSLGVKLVYYRARNIGTDATVYLKNGNNGGNIVTENVVRNFEEPKFYYRPIPQQQIVLNPNLKQIFGW
ncbi:SusD-like starch-binding protein associating with outer membrane [Mucilaginibacter oryzae]|uniref:SusD-like starch-binding protein associating with outer membrane n=1 Tax=Mucilaginibacter oryzae TaxID=468058 RepID=A0A316HDY5_9SPHI|nr:RagB/SusD family nutrient uptake outer membrane protein [Mucilaginibacter oryzae]PWK78798.1 SusD-like starch-binding protein associating with outer membrane [Mucilaginibacter oryzae]